MSKIDSILNKVKSLKGFENSKYKGDAGEEAVIEIVKQYEEELLKLNPNYKCALWHSVVYNLATDSTGNYLPGNYKLQEDGLYKSTSGTYGEIDVLFVTPFRIFIIEVKTYNAYVLVNDDWTYKGQSPNALNPIDWCNLTQVEKSARHMYHILDPVIPEGDPRYIAPILVYAQGKIKIDTSDYDVTLLNGLKKTLASHKPLDYVIDVNKVIQIISTMKGERL